MNPNLDLFPNPIPPDDDTPLNPFGELIAQLTDYEPQTYDPETGLTMSIEQITIQMPIEMRIETQENGEVTVKSSAPTQNIETTIMPVFHRLQLRVVTNDG
ncbi:hypothetical protein H6G33_31185 [Calothrix sp. FACHB-1219]|uniref:hypothetical protein n=1 Tax=unclassified Calothrix TaxID=2619626 RepID=UPI001689DFD3|nr:MULTISPECIES: hypothetical protein [unclassified Calothrix]MBD2206940.1 hypothetical protein [Calothrix sp. FACHB-168]MBD2221438.1 hypothetical protein [Calothrix sp. FACHB-1219]